MQLVPFWNEDLYYDNCCVYYPTKVQQQISSPDFEITCLECIELIKNLYRRKLKIRNKITNKIANVTHFHYDDWPMHYGIPPDKEIFALQAIVRTIFNYKDMYPNSPPVLHCDNGSGKTGTIIAMTILT